MALKIYNTLTGKKEIFTPLVDGKVSMYVCGVTVYDLCHLGHARGCVVFDIIRRYFEYKGYDVCYVRNFTDIDDKIINRANEGKCSPCDIANQYIKAYRDDFDKLGVRPADIEPLATEHIDEMIAMVKTLIEKGFAYESQGDVFFAIKRFKEYGKLSGRSIEQMQAGARIEIDPRKENPLDFVLWKRSKQDEPKWDSPWGPGRPGWHLECSVMSMKYLGKTLDIHGGGKDLIFPHHENEIAQSEATTGVPFVRYFMHNGFISINQEKMSKSLKNFFTIRGLLEKYSPEAIRFFLLSTHYRSPIEFSDEAIEQSQKAIERIYIALENVERFHKTSQNTPSEEISTPWKKKLNDFNNAFSEAMDDDFNTAEAIGHIFELIKQINLALMDKSCIATQATPQEVADLLAAKNVIINTGSILGLFNESNHRGLSSNKLIDDLLFMITDVRNECRASKQWSIADMIRDRLKSLNVQLEDRSDGSTTWRIKRN